MLSAISQTPRQRSDEQQRKMLETLEKDFNKQIASYEVKHGKFQTLNDQLKAEVTEQELRFVQLRDEQAQESDRYTLELLQA